ncbi:signal transducer and activator of transcription 2-like [Hyperolius riggenbachi]|uniref:signal transducer and activator of transcription 2-like n=1 Tax=Hyperolius riggenbachi TaxID=752182 RepID=UPI0035A26A62
MSQWESLSQLPEQFQALLLELYNEDILPVDVRQHLATWIESQDWNHAEKDLSVARQYFCNLLNKCNSCTKRNQMALKLNFRKFKQKAETLYQENPQKLAEQIHHILQQEQQILSEAKEMESRHQVQMPMETSQNADTEQSVSEVKKDIWEIICEEVKILEEQMEEFLFTYNSVCRASPPKFSDEYFQTKRENLKSQLDKIKHKIKEVLIRMERLIYVLHKELDAWIKRQMLAYIGSSTDTSLDNLESWVTKTMEIIFYLRRLLPILHSTQCVHDGDPAKTEIQNLQDEVDNMARDLLRRSFVVEKQPAMINPSKRALVLVTKTQFSARVRLLVNLEECCTKMKVSYVIDKNPPDIKGYRRFNIPEMKEKTLTNLPEQGLVVDFEGLKLKKLNSGDRRNDKGARDSVFEELHRITFITHFEHERLKITLEAVTLPFVVISNPNQSTRAWASVLWFNLLSEDPKDVTFFCKPRDAPWTLLANAISWQFSCCTQRGLNEKQLEMLGEKLCGTVPTQKSTVKWRKFSKDKMKGFSFTFWVWFDATVKLVKEHLQNIWNDGHVMGFVSRSEVNSLLKPKQPGTFLLRFSESIKEAITYSWVEPYGKLIHSVAPYTKKDLSIIALTEIIRNYQLIQENIQDNPLQYLYPDVPRDEAFGKYYKEIDDVTLKGWQYVKRGSVIVSRRDAAESPFSSASGTLHLSETPLSDSATSEADACLDHMDMDGLDLGDFENLEIGLMLPEVLEEIDMESLDSELSALESC